MSNKENFQAKRKSVCEKDIQDYFFFLEDRLSGEPKKIEQFTSIVEEFNNQK